MHCTPAFPFKHVQSIAEGGSSTNTMHIVNKWPLFSSRFCTSNGFDYSVINSSQDLFKLEGENRRFAPSWCSTNVLRPVVIMTLYSISML